MSLLTHVPGASRLARLRPTGRIRLLGGGFITLLLASQLVGPPARAEHPAPTTRLSAAEARDAGQEIVLSRRRVGGSTLLVASLPEPAVDAVAPAFDAARLLDSSAGGATILAADVVAGFSANVTIQSEDGSQLLVSVPGVIDGELAPDGTWAAVIDGIGRLLRLDPATGSTEELAPGPFLGPIVFEVEGTLLLLGVSSVEAPWQSRLVRLDPATGALLALSGDELVYGAIPLADGLAYSAHDTELGSTVVRRVAPTGPELVADLGSQAIEVDVSRDGSTIAYEVVGEGVYLRSAVDGTTSRIGPGGDPRFSPDGELLAVERGRSTAIVRRDGSVADRIAELTVAWSECAEECAP